MYLGMRLSKYDDYLKSFVDSHSFTLRHNGLLESSFVKKNYLRLISSVNGLQIDLIAE